MKELKSVRAIHWILLPLALIGLIAITPVSAAITINVTLRNVCTTNTSCTSSNFSKFFIQWDNTFGNTEAITALLWKDSGAVHSLTNTFPNPLGTGCTSGNVEYFGNGWTPPDPESGGMVLVGAGTTGTFGSVDGMIVINSMSTSTGCTGSFNSVSPTVPVNTTYKFFGGVGNRNSFKVMRVYAFPTTFVPINQGTQCCELRAYIPRIFPISSFDEVWFPSTSAACSNANPAPCLSAELNVPADCQFGGLPGGSASCSQTLNWVSSGPHSWFVIHNPGSTSGVIVFHDSSISTTQTLTPQLWIDTDGGSQTTASSVLLVGPSTGFTGTLTEEETYCFYDSSNGAAFNSLLSLGASASTLELNWPTACIT